MDFDDDLSDPAFDMDNDSEDYSPAPKAKAPAKKAAATKAAPKKPTKAALAKLAAGKPAASKKRAKPTTDDEDNASDDDFGSGSVGNLSQTPPSASKQKKPPAKKAKSAGKPLAEIANDSLSHFDGADDAPTTAAQSKSSKTASEMYQKLTQLEHIIKRPDTYIGSVEHTEQAMWVYNKAAGQMEKRNVSFVPGLYKIFDEILVNAADNKQRDASMTALKVTIDRESGEISVENNGKGIAVEMHQKEKVYIPELLFGHLLTGSNYDDNEKKTVGGRNGYGAKLCNVFSTEFTVECQDSTNGKRYKQSWHKNMSIMDKAKITSNKTSDFVRVTYTPDYARFNMPNGIDDDLEALMYRRVYDMAGVVDGVKVYLNGEHLKVGFKKYCDLYAKAIAKERDEEVTGEELPPAATVQFEDPKLHKRWQIGFTVSDGSFQQVSFVNSIATTSGGTHVNYIADQICNALLTDLNKKKKGHSLKLNHIRNHIFIFVNCFIDNPAFTSQTKEQMTTKVSAFGSKCVLSDAFIKKIKSTDAINNIIHFAERKADKMMSKSDGNKRSRISNDKLVDANLAGTKHGHECTLILTEGDSARGLAVAGRAVLDPDRIGVFPLRGKLLNVRDASIDQITKNKEIQNIKQFLGLKHKQVYTDTKGLRYGHLMIMADQDHDGSHIKGLLINFLQVQFPSLLLIPDFFQEFITPVVKIWQGPNPKKPTKTKAFYTIPEYDEWKETHSNEVKRWEHKYLKGLGSSSNEDAQVYFTNLDAHLKDFKVMQSDEAQLFDLAFSKKKADARKEWLGNFVPGTFLDQSTKSITYSDFVNKELILFSMADNMRSIPSVLDGFKPGQRKVIYTCFKKNYVKDQKVFELAGTVSKLASYHHGDQSLHQTIVGLAQTFVGSNNINCLEPSGNFGSRLSGGSDAASARYIFTRLSPFARRVFNPMDEPVLENNIDEGSVIEPKNYAPIVPMVLINGADGIGTGWSTQIPNYNPVDIVNNLKRRMGRVDSNVDNEELPFEPMVPWFRGWKGTPEQDPLQPGRFRFNGIAFQDDKHLNEVIVTELPVRVWTDDFKAKLEEVIRAEKSPSWIKDYKEFNDHQNVHFVIQMDEKHMKSALDEGLIERFKLSKTIGTTNLVAFDTNGKIRRYEKVEDILEEYYQYRFGVYTQRKEHWLGVYHTEYRKIRNQYRFISEIMEGKLVVSKKKKAIVVQELRDRKYEAFPKDNGDAKTAKSKDDEDNVEEEDDDADGGSARDYDYLLSMAIWSFTQERLERLKKQIDAKKEQYDDLNSKSEKDLWCADLDEFMKEWENQLMLDADVQTTIRRMGRRASKKIGAGGRGRKVKDEDDYVEKKPARAPKVSAAMKALNAAKPVEKTSQRFAEMFSAKPKVKPAAASQKLGGDGAEDDFSDDDFAALAKPKKGKAAAPAPIAAADRVVDLSDEDEEMDDIPTIASAVAGGRTKRAAATKAKTWTLDSESDAEEDDDDEMLGDVGAMVKGIGGSEAKTSSSSAANGRLSLFAMSRPETSDNNGNSSTLPKTVRPKPSTKSFDFDSHDDTNYEALALSSPRKSTKGDDDVKSENEDDDDDDSIRPSGNKSAMNSTALSIGSTLAKKGRGRPAVAAKPKAAKEEPKKSAASSSTQLSPAAKAYAAKKAQARAALFDSDDSMDDMEEAIVQRKPAAKATTAKAAAKPAAKPAAKSAAKPVAKRAARAATTTKKKPVYVDSDDEDNLKDEEDEYSMDFE